MGSISPVVPLPRVRGLIAKKARAITRVASEGAAKLGLSPEDAFDEVSRLDPGEHKKTVPSTGYPGRWLDVYKHLLPDGTFAYVKLQEHPQGTLLVVSFKLWTPNDSRAE